MITIEIKYRSRIMPANLVEPTERECLAIGELADERASLSAFFKRDFSGLGIKDGGVYFQYESDPPCLYCVAVFQADFRPDENQLAHLLEETSRQIDSGYYGEDGWFVDIGQNSYYIIPLDRRYACGQPVAVRVSDDRV